MVIWKHSQRPKVDLMDFHNITRVRCLSNVDLLDLLVVWVQSWLSGNLRLLRWSRMSDLWLSLG